VQSRQDADCSYRFESLEPANLTSPFFITDEKSGGLLLRLNQRLSFAFVQLVHQQADVCLVGCHASLKTPGLVKLIEPLPKFALLVHFLMNLSRDVNDIEKPG
jgi:hypothetical protein